MMVGLIEFMYRLLNPIEEKSPRMYHFDVAYGQLIGMLLLSLICYQFTIVGEGVYIDAIRAFIRNSSLLVKWQLFSLPVGQHEIQVFFDQLGKPPRVLECRALYVGDCKRHSYGWNHCWLCNDTKA